MSPAAMDNTHREHLIPPHFKGSTCNSKDGSDSGIDMLGYSSEEDRPRVNRSWSPHPSEESTDSVSSQECLSRKIGEPIAVIGMSFKFPQGAEDPDSFWETLVERRCTATKFPEDRFNVDAFWNEDSTMPNHVSLCPHLNPPITN
jgi:hypothetical protein